MRSPRLVRRSGIERGSVNSAYVRRAHNATRVAVDHHHAGRACCETRGHEHVRHRDGCAGSRPAREHVSGKQTMLGGETRNAEDLDELIGDQQPQVPGEPSSL